MASRVQVSEEAFGTIRTSNGDQSVTKFTLNNVHGVRVQLISYGAALTELSVPDKNGQLEDILLGFDDLDGRYRCCSGREQALNKTNNQTLALVLHIFKKTLYGCC